MREALNDRLINDIYIHEDRAFQRSVHVEFVPQSTGSFDFTHLSCPNLFHKTHQVHDIVEQTIRGTLLLFGNWNSHDSQNTVPINKNLYKILHHKTGTVPIGHSYCKRRRKSILCSIVITKLRQHTA